jgi:hypothetical protein
MAIGEIDARTTGLSTPDVSLGQALAHGGQSD